MIYISSMIKEQIEQLHVTKACRFKQCRRVSGMGRIHACTRVQQRTHCGNVAAN